MGKRYVMFVDERGFLSTGANDNLSMVGVAFEYDYCIESKNRQCELSKKLNEFKNELFDNSSIPLDDIMLQENVYNNIDKMQRAQFVNGLPQLFKGLKFTVISSTIKKDKNGIDDSYSKLVSAMLKKYHSLILKKNADCGGIILEARKGEESHKIQQSFFDIYNERIKSLCTLENSQDKINTFIVCEKTNTTYGLGIQVLNVLNNVLYRVSNGLRDVDRKLISYIEYGNKNKIFDSINHKIYKDNQIDVSINELQGAAYNNIESFSKELDSLKDEIKFRDKRISEKEKEINDLTEAIQLLNKQLEEALLSRKSDSIIFQILSDIDFKMKGLEKKSMAAKH
ncbi:DUF3800 domain-containing protein [Clostridium sp. C2-6-12]|uniref:DUF3800 domain-containing protein n=1 Tax=Clostridium sp. C2-6-12 TaxID=2698832 RepID=UPI001924EAFC|nr:DUF3800 domain-containing protein [Clostridium sp. C2-6-12]